MTQKRAPKTYREPQVYEVGKDLAPERLEELQVKIADWFREFRPDHKEPAADARLRIRCCLEGKTLKGQPWFTAWNAPLRSRIAMLCRFDSDKMEPIRTGDPAKKAAKQRTKEKENRKLIANRGANDKYIPEITRKEQDGRLKYGDKALPVTEAEKRVWEEYRDAYLTEFPELRTVNARGELSLLCDLQVVHERNRMKLLNGDRVAAQDMLENAKLITEMKKALNIHPEQVARRVKQEEGGSIAEAAARFEAMPKEVRDRFLAEELLILYQQFVSPSPREDMGGFQLDEVGLFGATRCRTCACAKCGTRNYAGFTIEEVERHLVDKGWLIPIPGLASPVDDLLSDGADANGVEALGEHDGGGAGLPGGPV